MFRYVGLLTTNCSEGATSMKRMKLTNKAHPWIALLAVLTLSLALAA